MFKRRLVGSRLLESPVVVGRRGLGSRGAVAQRDPATTSLHRAFLPRRGTREISSSRCWGGGGDCAALVGLQLQLLLLWLLRGVPMLVLPVSPAPLKCTCLKLQGNGLRKCP